jgi:hypothetical protein
MTLIETIRSRDRWQIGELRHRRAPRVTRPAPGPRTRSKAPGVQLVQIVADPRGLAISPGHLGLAPAGSRSGQQPWSELCIDRARRTRTRCAGGAAAAAWLSRGRPAPRLCDHRDPSTADHLILAPAGPRGQQFQSKHSSNHAHMHQNKGGSEQIHRLVPAWRPRTRRAMRHGSRSAPH